MDGFVRIISEKFNLKKPQKSKKNIFTIFSPIKASIETADTLSIDTELSIKLPENSTAFVATKFKGQEILRIIGPTFTKKMVWITLLNESYLNKYQINNGDVIGYLVIKPENIKTYYEPKKKPSRQKKRCPNNYLPENWETQRKSYFEKKKDISPSDRRFFE